MVNSHSLYDRITYWYTYPAIMVTITMLINCSTDPSINSDLPAEADFDMPKIDFHAHYRAERDYLIPLLDSFNLQPVLVDVGRVDTERWHQQRAGLIENYKNHTDRYFFCTAFTANDIDQPDYAQRVIEHIKHDLEQGASMVKVWKNFGMISKGDSGAYVQIDDPRIQPVWDFLVAQDIPVLAHIGEPLQAWRPLDDDNPHAGYFREHPEYHAYQHPEIPSWETIQQARNNWLKNNPDLIVVGAHHGSMSHDVGLIGETLDKYPNFNVEPAARFADLALQNSDSVRNYYVKYQDRILYGTDYGTSGDEQDMTEVEKVGEKKRLAQRMDAHWKYLSTFDTVEILVDPPIPTRGLGLPDSVLRKVYYLNAIRILKIDN